MEADTKPTARSLSTQDLSDDEIQLRAQGHVGEMPRQFGLLSALSMGFSITNSWTAFAAILATPLYAGGGPSAVYSLLVATVACSFINAGLAELASAFPSSGGQYHFTYMVAAPKHRAVLAFACGWLSVLAWAMATSPAYSFCAQLILIIASFLHPEYESTRWQVYLIYTLLIIIAAVIVICMPRQLPLMEQIFFWTSISAFIATTVAMLARSPSKQSAATVFVEWTNETGWPDGMAFLLSTGSCMYMYVGLDATTHIAEEMPHPSRTLPRAIFLTMIIATLTSFMWAFAFMFAATDLDAVAAAKLPVLTLYTQSLHNDSLAIFFIVWLLLVYYGAAIGCLVTSGRQTWALARDNGLPHSALFARIHPTLQTPAAATLLTAAFIAVYGAIYVGSTTAFNSFVSLAILGLNTSYAIPQALVLFRGRDKVLPKERYFDLGGVMGPFCNAFSVAWVALYTVLFCFPVFLPVDAGSMNYLGVVVVGVGLLILGLWWGGKRGSFVGPVVVDLEHLDSVVGTPSGASDCENLEIGGEAKPAV